MFSKIISIFLVYVLCVANFAILTLPYILILYPFLHFTSFALLGLKGFVLMCAFFLSSIMFIMWFFDFVFSSSIKSYFKVSKSYRHKNNKKYFTLIDKIYKQIRQQYGIEFEILIMNSNSIEAFATASFSKKIVVISNETIQKIERSCKSLEEFELAISGVLAHEASHLLNSDFLPGALLNINKSATYKMAKFTGSLYTIVLLLLAMVPVIGSPFALFAHSISKTIQGLLRFFMDVVIMKIYHFVSKILTRGLEYRSDADAARIFGPESISLGLQILAGNAYNSIFSTHPSTPTRINAAKKIKQTKDPIRQNFFTSILNIISSLFNHCIATCVLQTCKSKINLHILYEFINALSTQIHLIRYKINHTIQYIKHLIRF